MMENPAIRKKSLAEELAARLQEQIAAGTFGIGEKLPPEPELMRIFGVGRSTVREAVRILSDMGLLRVRQGAGTFVVSRNAPDLMTQRLKRAEEELEHANKLIEFGVTRGGEMKISPIDAVPGTWAEPKAVFEHVYKHECHVSELIDNLMDVAIAENDKATQEFLRWFVNEQVAEEENAQAILDKFNVFGVHGLYCVDHDLAKR